MDVDGNNCSSLLSHSPSGRKLFEYRQQEMQSQRPHTQASRPKQQQARYEERLNHKFRTMGMVMACQPWRAVVTVWLVGVLK